MNLHRKNPDKDRCLYQEEENKGQCYAFNDVLFTFLINHIINRKKEKKSSNI